MESVAVKSGERYCKLLVLSEAPATLSSRGWKVRNWLCVCDCGKTTTVQANNLLSGNTKSCGCHKVEVGRIQGAATKTHGHTNTPEHRIWLNLKYRCTAPNAPNRRYYSDQGVKVDEHWMRSFESFLDYVGFRPSPEHTIDRYPDRNGNYEPGNVRWATKAEQAQNRRNTELIEINGVARVSTEWDDLLGFRRGLTKARFNKGWRDDRLLAIGRAR